MKKSELKALINEVIEEGGFFDDMDAAKANIRKQEMTPKGLSLKAVDSAKQEYHSAEAMRDTAWRAYIHAVGDENWRNAGRTHLRAKVAADKAYENWARAEKEHLSKFGSDRQTSRK